MSFVWLIPILAVTAAAALWNMPDACRALAGKFLEREAYILAGRKAKAQQAQEWAAREREA
jgi:hypothetical protein